MWIFKTKDDDLIYIENTDTTQVLTFGNDMWTLTFVPFEEGNANQLWKKGELDAEDYFTLENSNFSNKFLTTKKEFDGLEGIDIDTFQLKGNLTMR